VRHTAIGPEDEVSSDGARAPRHLTRVVRISNDGSMSALTAIRRQRHLRSAR
jgi:hypothetical protein